MRIPPFSMDPNNPKLLGIWLRAILLLDGACHATFTNSRELPFLCWTSTMEYAMERLTSRGEGDSRKHVHHSGGNSFPLLARRCVFCICIANRKLLVAYGADRNARGICKECAGRTVCYNGDSASAVDCQHLYDASGKHMVSRILFRYFHVEICNVGRGNLLAVRCSFFYGECLTCYNDAAVHPQITAFC